MNATTSTFSHITSFPATLYQYVSAAFTSRFSYVQIPHIKLKAEHQALVLWNVAKIGWTYWEGWRDGKKGVEVAEAAKGKKRKGRKKNRKLGRGSRVVGRGNYTVVFQ